MSKAFLFATLVFVLSAQAAEPASRNIAGVYSDLYYNSEAGDLLGMELLLVPRSEPNTYAVFVQVAEGNLPYTALLKATVDGGRFSLTFKSGSGPYADQTVYCQIATHTIVCRWPSGEVDDLRWGKSYWEGGRRCRTLKE